MAVVKTLIKAGWPDTQDEVPYCIREYFSYRDERSVQNGLVFILATSYLCSHFITRRSVSGRATRLLRCFSIIFCHSEVWFLDYVCHISARKVKPTGRSREHFPWKGPNTKSDFQSLAASFLLFVPICPLSQILASKEFLLTLNAWCMLPDFRRPLYIITFLAFGEHYSTQPKISIEWTARFVWSLALHFQQTSWFRVRMMLRGDFHILRNFLIIENTSEEYEARLVTHFLTFLGVSCHRIVYPGVHQLIMFLGIKLDSLTMYLRCFEKVKATDRSRNEKVSCNLSRHLFTVGKRHHAYRWKIEGGLRRFVGHLELTLLEH